MKGEWVAGTDISSRIGSPARGRGFDGVSSGVWSCGRDRSEEATDRERRRLGGSRSKKGSCKVPDTGSEPPKSEIHQSPGSSVVRITANLLGGCLPRSNPLVPCERRTRLCSVQTLGESAYQRSSESLFFIDCWELT